MRVLLAMLILVLVCGALVSIPIGLNAFGRARGWGDSFAPPVEPPPRAQWPLACKLHLLHRWRANHTAEGNYQRCIGCGRTRDVPLIRSV